jgi:glycine cleavage system H protein
MSKIPENLFYTKEHEWVQIEGDTATVGITDFAQSSLGDIVFVELPDVDSELDQGSTFGVVESIKSVSDLYVPVKGTVIAKNEDVEETPESVNEDAYAAWFIKLKLSDSSQVESLMNAEKYKEFCESN